MLGQPENPPYRKTSSAAGAGSGNMQPLATMRSASGALACSLAFGFVGSCTVAGKAVSDPVQPDTSDYASNDAVPFDYPENADGQTYGNLPDATSLENEPDLVLAENSDEVQGYIYLEELRALEGWGIDSLEEAWAWEANRDSRLEQLRASGADKLVMYESDGRTEVGLWDGFNPTR